MEVTRDSKRYFKQTKKKRKQEKKERKKTKKKRREESTWESKRLPCGFLRRVSTSIRTCLLSSISSFN